MKAKILVTGGAGYIGSFMVRHLEKNGFDVVIADNLSQGHQEAVRDFRLEVIDLVTEKEKLDSLFKRERFNGVIHMAGFIQMGESFKNPSKYFRNNLISATNVLDSMVKYHVSNFILSSSAGVYGNPESLPIKEDDKKEPLNPYGETKYMIEKMLEWYDKAYGLKFMAIRYFNAAGAALDGSIGEDHPDESHLIPLVMKAGLKKEKVVIYGNDYKTDDGTCIRDYIHVLDLVETHEIALRKLLEGSGSDFFNAGVGCGYSNNKVVETVEKVTGLNISVEYGPRRRGDAAAFYASNEKIKKILGWKPKYDLQEIIQSAYLWHRNNPSGYSKY